MRWLVLLFMLIVAAPLCAQEITETPAPVGEHVEGESQVWLVDETDEGWRYGIVIVGLEDAILRIDETLRSIEARLIVIEAKLEQLESNPDPPDVEQPAPVDPNTATLEELMRLPRLGGDGILAQRIIDARVNVVFRTAADLAIVKGIGESTVAELEPFLIFSPVEEPPVDEPPAVDESELTMAFDTAVLALSPHLFWLCDDTSGTSITDASGNGRAGTLTGGTLGQAGPFTGASSVLFDGVDDRIQRSSVDLSGEPRTIVMWVKLNALTSSMRLAVLSNSYPANINQFSAQHVSNTGVRAIVDNEAGGSLSLGTAQAISADTWYMLTLRRGSDASAPAQLIVNNFDATSSAGDRTAATTAMELIIGYGSDASPQAMDGYVSRVALFDARLSDAQIGALYDAAFDEGGVTGSDWYNELQQLAASQ